MATPDLKTQGITDKEPILTALQKSIDQQKRTTVTESHSLDIPSLTKEFTQYLNSNDIEWEDAETFVNRWWGGDPYYPREDIYIYTLGPTARVRMAEMKAVLEGIIAPDENIAELVIDRIAWSDDKEENWSKSAAFFPAIEKLVMEFIDSKDHSEEEPEQQLESWGSYSQYSSTNPRYDGLSEYLRHKGWTVYPMNSEYQDDWEMGYPRKMPSKIPVTLGILVGDDVKQMAKIFYSDLKKLESGIESPDWEVARFPGFVVPRLKNKLSKDIQEYIDTLNMVEEALSRD